MDLSKIGNLAHDQDYIRYLDGVLDIIITEHFMEFLLLLKNKLCWSYKDSLYISLKVNDYETLPEGPAYEQHKAADPSSYMIYEYFLQKNGERTESTKPIIP